MTPISSETEIDRHVDRAGDTLGRAVAGAGLAGRHVRVGHEVDVGAGDAAGVGGEDDGAVHLRQLGQPLRAEGGVEQEAARADGEHLGPVADDDQRAHVACRMRSRPSRNGGARARQPEGPAPGRAATRRHRRDPSAVDGPRHHRVAASTSLRALRRGRAPRRASPARNARGSTHAGRRLRHDGCSKPSAGPRPPAGCLPDLAELAAEPDFAESDEIGQHACPTRPTRLRARRRDLSPARSPARRRPPTRTHRASEARRRLAARARPTKNASRPGSTP